MNGVNQRLLVIFFTILPKGRERERWMEKKLVSQDDPDFRLFDMKQTFSIQLFSPTFPRKLKKY